MYKYTWQIQLLYMQGQKFKAVNLKNAGSLL